MTDPDKKKTSKKKGKKSRKRRSVAGHDATPAGRSRGDHSHGAAASAVHSSSEGGALSGSTNLPLLIAAGAIAIFALSLPPIDGGHASAHGAGEAADEHAHESDKVGLIKGEEAEDLARLAEELDELPLDPDAEQGDAPEEEGPVEEEQEAPPEEEREQEREESARVLPDAPPLKAKPPAVVELEPPKLEPPTLKPPKLEPPSLTPPKPPPPKASPPPAAPPPAAPPPKEAAPPKPAPAAPAPEKPAPEKPPPAKPAPAPPKPIMPESNPY